MEYELEYSSQIFLYICQSLDLIILIKSPNDCSKWQIIVNPMIKYWPRDLILIRISDNSISHLQVRNFILLLGQKPNR